MIYIMFDKIEYELLILKYMPKDEYKKLINKYMDELKIPYITAKQYICLKQIKRFEYENKVKYDQVFLKTYNDIVENGYNISIL
jgi:hypothetical protein